MVGTEADPNLRRLSIWSDLVRRTRVSIARHCANGGRNHGAVRRAGSFLVTDGPFAETKEALGGYDLLEANDLDQALEFAKLCPAYAAGSRCGQSPRRRRCAGRRRSSVGGIISATRAHLLRQLGRSGEAELAYRHAMTLTSNPVERRYLHDRAQSCADE